MKSLQNQGFYIEISKAKGASDAESGKSGGITLGFDEGRVPVMRDHKGKPSGKAAPSAPASTLSMHKGTLDVVASTAIFDGAKLLMGKRNDNGKWTLPGGILEDGEDPKDGAKRELKEEAGISARLTFMGEKTITTPKGQTIRVFAYRGAPKAGKPDSDGDPDKEVEKWEWIDVSGGLPKDIAANLHSRKNVTLNFLGLQKGQYTNLLKSLCQSIDGSRREEHVEEFFVYDLIKARSHKYIRKYQRGGKWQYVYYEPGQRPRSISEEAVKALKELGEMGDEGAKAVHDSIETIDENILKILRQLSDMGDNEAYKKLKDEYGIDREKEKLEEQLIPEQVAPKDRTEEKLSDPDHNKVAGIISVVLDSKIFGYLLNTHRSTQYGQKLEQSGIKLKDVTDKIKEKKTLKDMFEELHRQMNRIDSIHSGLPRSENTEVQSQGSYGNLGYNTAVAALEAAEVFPGGYSRLQKRLHSNINQPELPLMPIRELAARQEAEKRAAEERKRAEEEALAREAGDLGRAHGESVADMLNYFGGTLNTQEKIHLMKGIDKFFGKSFKFKNFLSYIQGNPGVEVKIENTFMSGLRSFGGSARNDTSLHVEFDFINKSTGRKVTGASRGIIKNSDGSITWDNHIFSRAQNEDLKRFPGMARGLYNGVEKLLREVTADWTGDAKTNTKIVIGSCANSGFNDHGFKGALVWAKHYFDFTSGESTASHFRDTWKSRMDRYAENLGLPTEEVKRFKDKIDTMKYPYEFVKTGFFVNKAEAIRATGRSRLDWDFDQQFEAHDSVDIGEIIMTDTGASWSGINWIHKTEGRPGHLNELRKIYYGGQRGSREAGVRFTVTAPERMPARPSAPPTTRAPPISPMAGRPSRAQSYVGYWGGRRTASGRTARIRMTQRRFNELRRWPTDDVNEFVRLAALTPASRRTIREILSSRGT